MKKVKGKKLGTAKECLNMGQLRLWGLNQVDDIDAMLAEKEQENKMYKLWQRLMKEKDPVKKAKLEKKIEELKKGSGIASTLADTGLEMFIQHGIPWLGKKAVEVGRYAASEAIRNPRIKGKVKNTAKQMTKKGVDYLIDKAGDNLIETAADLIRPKGYRKVGYKGGNIQDWYPMHYYTDVTDPTNPLYQRGEGFDIHNAILKVAPKKGFVMPGHHYTGQMD